MRNYLVMLETFSVNRGLEKMFHEVEKKMIREIEIESLKDEETY